MSLALSLSNAVSGLQAAQANLGLISSNVANAQTPGYSRQILADTTQINSGTGGGGVQTGVSQRVVDQVLNNNLRTQNSITSAASTLDSYFQRIQDLFGSVGTNLSLNHTLANFSSALQTLAATPEDTVAQANAISQGQALTQQLNDTSASIQSLRTNADTDINTAVATANTLITNIANFNGEIAHARAFNESTATLEDQRDQALRQLSQQLDIQSFTRADDSVVVLTAGGKTLVNSISEPLTFTPSGSLSATTAGSPVTVNGIDITSEIKGGTIGALLQMRNTELPNLTAELNQLSKNLFNTAQQTSQILTVGGGAPVANDVFNVTINGAPIFATLPLTSSNPPTAPNLNDVVAAINTAIKAQPASSNLSTISAVVNGTNIEFTDTAANPLAVTIAAGPGTETFTPQASTNFRFFANVTGTNIDNAATIAVNSALVSNPSALNGPLGAPDPTISANLASNITSATPTFTAAGNFPANQNLTLNAYAAQILGQNATAASAASDNATFQSGVQGEISARSQSVSAVNIDEELANLTVFQNSYAASAHVISVVQTMFDSLLQTLP